jgi:hypothetical protein
VHNILNSLGRPLDDKQAFGRKNLISEQVRISLGASASGSYIIKEVPSWSQSGTCPVININFLCI